MEDYLALNKEYFSGYYNAPNVESFVFRTYGRILVIDFGIDGSRGERLLDFGCGQGGNVKFFDQKGFDVYGVDIAHRDIAVAKKVLAHKKNNFKVISPQPSETLLFFNEAAFFDIIISIQTLDFLSNTDFSRAIKCLYNQLKPGGKIYITMNAWEMYYREKHGTYLGDGLWSCKFDNGRVKYDLALNFLKDKDDMKEKLSIFKSIYIDSYDIQVRGEGSEKRYAFFGIKE